MTRMAPHPVVDDRPDISRLWYADPTGNTAIRNVLTLSQADDLAVVDMRGNVLFRIKPHVLADGLHAWNFTPTRDGRAIRAHKKNAPAGQGEGADNL